MNRKKGFSGILYILYQSTSDDLILWPLFDVLFLSLEKGYSDASVSLIFTVSLWVGIAVKMLCFRVLKRIRAGTSMVLATVLFLSGAVLITFGNTVFVTLVGQCFYRIAFCFQEMSSVFLQKAKYKDGTKPNFLRMKDAANIAYSVISLVAVIFLNDLCNIGMLLPMYICIGFCVNSVVLALLLRKYDNTDNSNTEMHTVPVPRHEKTDLSAVFCLVISALEAVILGLSMENLRIAVKSDLVLLFEADKVVLYFSLMLIVNRVIKCCGNIIALITSKKGRNSASSLSLLVAVIVLVPVLGLVSCFTNGIYPVLFACLGYFAAVSVYDPFGTRIEQLLTECRSPESMKWLVFLNSSARDLSKAAVSSVITVVLVYVNMSAVMLLLFAFAATLLVFFCLVRNRLKSKANNNVFTRWTEKDTAGVDELMTAATVLLCYYNVIRSSSITPKKLSVKIGLVEQLSSRYRKVRYCGIEPYREETLHQYFSDGRPVAVHIKRRDVYEWLPVLLADEDGMMLFSTEDKWVFTDKNSEMDSLLSFEIK